ncbi:hypothetical protein ACQP00_19405 [Dactylosporangium sp. CS-047395]|uniref:hypothetical protein n=1 Tax=Dactylosporangium sp. CS-047395 TaxID=3239936 RepID=UPI003D8EF74A
MTSYHGVATLILASGERASGRVSATTGTRGGIETWSAAFAPDDPAIDVLNASDDCQLELPDGRTGNVVIASTGNLLGGTTVRLTLTGSGPAPF